MNPTSKYAHISTSVDTQKLFGFPLAGHEAPAFVIYVGGGVELVGGLLVMLGLFTRPAAFICSGQMAVAYWMFYGCYTILRGLLS